MIYIYNLIRFSTFDGEIYQYCKVQLMDPFNFLPEPLISSQWQYQRIGARILLYFWWNIGKERNRRIFDNIQLAQPVPGGHLYKRRSRSIFFGWRIEWIIDSPGQRFWSASSLRQLCCASISPVFRDFFSFFVFCFSVSHISFRPPRLIHRPWFHKKN
jgi:hypothetical protein